MAKGAARPGEEKKSSGGIAGILIVTLLAAGGGGGFGLHLSGSLKEKEPPPQKDAASKKEDEKPKVAADTILVEMTPIIANLAEPKSAWIRIEASLVVGRELEGVQALSGKIAEDITAYLRTTTLAQFEGGSGFQNLREDLNERARLRGGKDVKELVVHGVVVE
jgi:flagellar FliL protein